MGIMAVGALDLALDDRMMRDFVSIGTHIPMAVKTDGRLIDRGAGLMDCMATYTGNIVTAVLTHIPQGQVR